MAHFRKLKEEIRHYLNNQEFQLDTLPQSLKNTEKEQWISPLFACLLEVEPLLSRSAQMLGYTIAKIYEENKEKARIIIRRMIWQMNEESGNIGWGIPLAFAYSLIHSKGLTEEYHRILISYIRDRNADSNYCDFAPLRIQCFNAVEILLDTYPEYIAFSSQALLQGIDDTDTVCSKKASELVAKYKIKG